MEPIPQYINYYQCKAGFKTPARCFPFPYLLYVHKGKGWFVIGENQYEAKGGECFFCPPGTKNIIIADDKDPFLLTGIDYIHCDIVFKPCTITGNDPEFLWILHQLISRGIVGFSSCSAYEKSLFKTLLLLIESISNRNQGTNVAQLIKNHLISTFPKTVFVKEISQKFGYHPNYINKIIKKELHTTIRQFQLEIKISSAISYLHYSHLSIAEISDCCGFASANYFSRLFKKKMKVSPQEYRQECIKNQRG